MREMILNIKNKSISTVQEEVFTVRKIGNLSINKCCRQPAECCGVKRGGT